MVRVAAVTLSALCWSSAAFASQSVHLDDPLPALKVELGGGLEVALGAAEKLQLERFRVFEPGAQVVIHGEGGRVEHRKAPDHAYFRGRVASDPTSRAFLVVRESGEVRGLVTRTRGVRLIAREVDGSFRSREIGSEELAIGGPAFTCGAEGHETSLVDLLPGHAGSSVAAPTGNLSYTARVAIETDFEYLGKFGGSTTAATDYAGDLIGFISAIYDGEVATNLTIPSVSLWTTASDPWAQTAANCGMFEFGKYWNANNGAVSRTIAHFLSGKSANSGIAWVGVLCSASFTYNITGQGCSGMATSDTYGGGYGYTGGIDGNFNPDSPAVLWDVVAVAHEIGHNFNSPHTHCYADLGGNSNPVDSCYAGECGNTGCYCGSTSLPGGAASGTIMSYCHLLSGGLGNISLTFGTGHPFGTVPQRVPDRMRAHVESRAASNAACLARVENSLIFEDGFESANTSVWDVVSP